MAASTIMLAGLATFRYLTALLQSASAGAGTTGHPTAAPTSAETFDYPNPKPNVGATIHVLLEGLGADSATMTGTFALYGYIPAANGGNGGWAHLIDLNNGAAISQVTQPQAVVDSTNIRYVEQVTVSGVCTAYKVRCLAMANSTSWTPAIGAVRG